MSRSPNPVPALALCLLLVFIGDAIVKAQPQLDVERLYREHGASVYRRALRLLGNRPDAEEATQEVFVRILHTEAAYQGKGELCGWLYRITTHHCLNRIRDQRRRRELLQEHVMPMMETASASAAADLVLLRSLLADADERQAQAAVYVYLDGMSYEEAAPLLGVSKRTVGNLLERFQSFCAKRLSTAVVASQGVSGQPQARARSTETS